VIFYHVSFHGLTGATIAHAQTANVLAEKYRVKFVTHAFSDLNVYLEQRVEMTRRLPESGEGIDRLI